MCSIWRQFALRHLHVDCFTIDINIHETLSCYFSFLFFKQKWKIKQTFPFFLPPTILLYMNMWWYGAWKPYYQNNLNCVLFRQPSNTQWSCFVLLIQKRKATVLSTFEYCLQMQAVDAKVLTGSIQKATIIQSSLAQGEIYTLQ